MVDAQLKTPVTEAAWDHDALHDHDHDHDPDHDHDHDHDPDLLSVLSIQRTCFHDGPGIRTTVFFQGCPLRCRWCHNPESQAFAVSAPAGSAPGRPVVGQARTVPEILEIVARDAEYYRGTHGGLTLSGGEPLAQPRRSLVKLLEEAQKAGISVAVETSGDVPWSALEACLPFVDRFLFDLKIARNDRLHKELTGRSRRRIQENLDRLVAAGAEISFRMCVVPGLTDGLSNLEDTAALLKSIHHPAIELMRYYNLHERKAQRLELPQDPLGISAEQSALALDRAAATLRGLGIDVHQTATEVGRRPAAFTPRIRALHQAIRSSGHAVCIESAELKTKFHKKHLKGHPVREPLAVRRAQQLRYLLNHKQLIAYPHELVVGNFTSKRVGGNLWVEYFGAFMVANLWNIDRQKPVAFDCSLSEKLRFYFQVAPYWLPRGILTRAFSSPAELFRAASRVTEKAAGFNNNLSGIAHYIVNCERFLTLGTTGIAQEVEAHRKQNQDQDSGFYDGVLIALRGLEEYAARFADHLRECSRHETSPRRREELAALAAVCDNVPRNPARTFHEALQSLMFLQIGLCTESFENAISLGRLDQALFPYYEADVAAGRLDYDAAKELLACFILKFDEIVFLNDGDTGFEVAKIFESLSPVETVTLGGTDCDGADCTNDVSYMLLDICELKPIGVNMAARLHPGSPAKVVERIAAVYLNGSPMPALYNDEVYVAALLQEYETTAKDAGNYSIVGCVEPVASDDHFANTDSANINLALPFLQALAGDRTRLWRQNRLHALGQKLSQKISQKLSQKLSQTLSKKLHSLFSSYAWSAPQPYNPPATMDALLERFAERLNELVHDVLADQQLIEATLARTLPTPLASSLYRGCIESGKDVYDGGTTINSSGIQAVGVTDVADSLLAIDHVVFQTQRYSVAEVLRAMDADFQGDANQAIQRALLAAPKFGNDDASEAHRWVERVLQLYVDALRGAEHKHRGGKYVAGYYGLNANMAYGQKTPALPSGRKAGVPLANSLCPHYGMQQVDLTSALNAVAKVDFTRFAPNGTTLTSTIDSGLFPGERGIKNLAALIRGYFNQGGMQFQPNLVDRELLLDAYRNPGKHKDLVVRIAGYCAYFDDLSDDLKREIIDRSYYTH